MFFFTLVIPLLHFLPSSKNDEEEKNLEVKQKSDQILRV
jgi:hypothetical protein